MNGARRWSSSKLLSSNRAAVERVLVQPAAVECTVSKRQPSNAFSCSRRRLSRR
uniref:Uncharacterized protein n=1 Tax=Cucumis melo TaxID=3656 RepID=A0A9I9E3N3_CUCME